MSSRNLLRAVLLLALSAPFSAWAAETPLTQASVRAMVERAEDASRKLDVDGIATHLAEDCEITLRGPTAGPSGAMRMSKAEYLAILAPTLEAISRQGIRYSYDSSDPKIRIESGGGAAVVTSTTTESLQYPDGRSLKMVTLSTTRIEPRDGALKAVAITLIEQTAT
jgi:hypothetical protein